MQGGMLGNGKCLPGVPVYMYAAFDLYGLKPAKPQDLIPASKTLFLQKKQLSGLQRAWTRCAPCQWKVRHP